ncbi:hypothetical protein GCM10011444_04200 [Winogradskyella haliclonae]|uniref:Uncharacterized protein n=2 Tax=Winogradskyella haliclonae TaxID=2048558 RepID=A0ABQ2BUF3_9FLAO|nr:hypothetical protein GCM10011444_04200 [Winogradskyella haliclonae]
MVFNCGRPSKSNKEDIKTKEIKRKAVFFSIKDLSLERGLEELDERFFRPMNRLEYDFLSQDNATVKYKLIKDESIVSFEIIIGGEKVNNSSNGKISGVDVFSSGEILTRVTIKDGIGNYKLELTDLQYENEEKKRNLTPKPSDNVHTDGNRNIRKNLIFTEKPE